MNNNIPQRIKELAKQIELLSVDVAVMKQYINDEDDKKIFKNLVTIYSISSLKCRMNTIL